MHQNELILPFDATCCYTGTVIKHPVPHWVDCSFWHPGSDAQPWVSECPDVKNYKWRLNPVWHRMLYSYTRMSRVDVKELSICHAIVKVCRW